MWLLRKLNAADDVLYLISSKGTYSVGRKNGDLALSEDSSISRVHCTLHVAKRKDCPVPVRTSTGVWIIDQKSKYGTYVQKDNDWVKLKPEEREDLTHGCVIRFGLMENVWRLEYKPIIAFTSSVLSEQKQEIRALLRLIDGELINTWTKHCSILFVNQITLTVKVILALINGIPIVTCHYLNQLVQNVQNQLPWPNYKDFRPEIVESTLKADLVSLDVKHHRKELFNGKQFIFPTEQQFEHLKDVILCAGGTARVLDIKNKKNWDRFADDSVIVIQCPTGRPEVTKDLANYFKELTDVMKSRFGKRIVPESEIAQAVAYSSVEKYCNPKCQSFELRKDLLSTIPRGTLIESETPLCSEPAEESQRRVVLSSFTPLASDSSASEGGIGHNLVSLRKKRDHSPDGMTSSKRQALSHISETNSSIGSFNLLEPVNSPLLNEEPMSGLSKNLIGNPTKPNKGSAAEKPKTSASSALGRNPAKETTKKPETEVRRKPTTFEADDDLDPFWSLPNPKTQNQGKRRHSSENENLFDEDNHKEKRNRLSNDMFDDTSKEPEPAKNPKPAEKPELVKKPNSNGKLPKAKISEKTEERKQAESTSKASAETTISENDLINKKPAQYKIPVVEDDDDDDASWVGVTDPGSKKSEKVEDESVLETTVVMLSLVSLAYTKDGAIVAPPPGVRNVKRFRKQRILSSTPRIVPIQSIDEEISDDDWNDMRTVSQLA